MPFLNNRGDVAHGIGGGLASLNNVPFAKGGVLGWRDDETIAFVNGDDNWFVSTYHVPSKTITRVDTRSANSGYAGGGHVVWWLATDSTIRSNSGLCLPGAGLLGCGPDGAVCYKPSYQSGGPTLVREFGGSDWQLTAGAPSWVSLLGNARAVLTEGQRLRGINLPPFSTVDGSVYRPTALYVNSEWWLCYYSGSRGIVLHPFGSLEGFIHLPLGTDGWHSAVVLRRPGTMYEASRIIRVATATHEGEQPGEVWVRDYDVAYNAVCDPWGDNVWQLSSRKPLVPVAPVLPGPTIALSLNRTTTEFGQAIVGTVTQQHCTTWRWLQDGNVNAPNDGTTHTFRPSVGTHTLAVRALGEDGSTISTPAQTVVVTAKVVTPPDPTPQPPTPPAPETPPPALALPKFMQGLQMGFGEEVATPIVDELTQFPGLQVMRVKAGSNADRTRRILAQVTSRGWHPLVLVTAVSQLEGIPSDVRLDVEVQNEPDIGTDNNGVPMAPSAYAAMVFEVKAWANARRAAGQAIRVWAGAVSNLHARGFSFLRAAIPLLPDGVGISAHWYAPAGTDMRAGHDHLSRQQEVDTLKALAGDRPWAITESGWHTAQQSKGWWIFKRRWRWTDAQVAACVAVETEFWRAQGASLFVLYQLNDGLNDTPLERYGVRRVDGSWKPVSQLWTSRP